LGFHKTAEGVFAPPGAGKDVIRTIHSIQRDDRLATCLGGPDISKEVCSALEGSGDPRLLGLPLVCAQWRRTETYRKAVVGTVEQYPPCEQSDHARHLHPGAHTRQARGTRSWLLLCFGP
jgi:hypothetical protein